MRTFVLVGMVATGCAGKDVECAEGFAASPDDGLCYPTTAPTVDDVIAGFEPCSLEPGDGRLDVEAGCADGVCGGDTFADINATLGEEGSCELLFDATMVCEWSGGIEVFLDDLDEDGVPDPDATSNGIFLNPPYSGTTDEGLGFETPVMCWIGAFGDPDSVEIARDEGDDEWQIVAAEWSELGLNVDAYPFIPGDQLDSIALFGADL